MENSKQIATQLLPKLNQISKLLGIFLNSSTIECRWSLFYQLLPVEHAVQLVRSYKLV